ncbi:MAG: hypothetical protein E7Z80_06660 [Methanobrevibacter thaueri]|nr:hypothetical protein [Methanobrevibacter thaueri]
MGNEEYISEFEGKFSVDRIFNDKKYNFGIFNTYQEALDKVDYLEEEGWPISKDIVEKKVVVDDLGLSLDNIEKVEDNFIVFKFINGEKVIFGEYDSLDEAKQIRSNLVSNAWESTERNTRSKYGKYILKDNNKFVVKRTYQGVNHFFGSFNTLDEALKRREELVSTNWGKLNIPLNMKKGKYISFNGQMYMIQRMVEGSVNVYGFFNDLESAIEQRDWLVKHGWSRLEVPDHSKRHIHKRGNEFLIYRRLKDDIEYFGTYDSLEEAKAMRNKLIENDWVMPDEHEGIEKISEHVYFDGDFYSIQNIVDGQKRVYGVYKNKNQAISDEKSFITYDWDGVYTVPTDDYPYGEHIVPFDYIFILENMENGVKKEIGRYFSFRDVVNARNEMFPAKETKEKLTFSVKIGKSYKNRGWSIIRDTTYDLVPKLDYEDECDIIVDGIPTTGKLNLLPRIFYNKDEKLVKHLEELAKTNSEGRIDVQLLLNKRNLFDNDEMVQGDLNTKINMLTIENAELNSSNLELREILEYMDDENRDYINKFNELQEAIEKLANIDISVEEMSTLPNAEIRLKIFDILDQIKVLKENFDKH